MQNVLCLRPATIRDSDILLKWRNDLQTRIASHNTSEVQKEDHLKWLAASLENKDRQLMIAEDNNIPVGTVRADYTNGVHEISWTVAPSARGCGLGKRIVALFVGQFSGPIRAEIKKGNYASIKIAEYAGMTLEKVEQDILHYRKDTILTSNQQSQLTSIKDHLNQN